MDTLSAPPPLLALNQPPASLNPEGPTPMHRALALARQALWLTSPNPRVGCVITAPDGQVLGEGHTQRAGQAHAEIMALQQAAAAGHSVQGATAWVTLEPCAHQGRTGPCCQALVTAGIGRVVVALQDPNPKVAGQGLAYLQSAGIQTEVGLLAAQARELNIGFFSRMERGRPWVRMKIAASLDGCTALDNGVSQWITGPQARADGQAWRARACAVMTGIGTVLQDDPLLNVRDLGVPRQPHLVVIDSRLDLPPAARLLGTQGSGDQCRQILVFTACAPGHPQRKVLGSAGAEILDVPGPGGKVDLGQVLQRLGDMEINELHVEAGFKLNGSMLREGLVDELLVYLAPRLLGSGQGMARLPVLQELPCDKDWRFMDSVAIGGDLRLLLRRAD
jgi:diaminohydroxyphosphoribosylaminopyrimidine deaminase/5-amino-6-(5-phosphoribosylamino)uracil reductase